MILQALFSSESSVPVVPGVVLTNHTVFDNGSAPAAVSAFSCNDDGTAGYATFWMGSGTYPGEWGNGVISSNYDIRWTTTAGGGPTSGSAVGTWLNLGTSRSWAVTQSVAGTYTTNGTVEIRDASTLVVLASATIGLVAQRS